MKYLYIISALLLLLSCGKKKSEVKIDYELSDPVNLTDFQVIYNFNRGDEYFSSLDSIYTRQYLNESKSIRVALTVEDKKKIFEVIKKADILTMPNQIERGGGRCALPSFSTEIIVQIGEVEKRIYDHDYCEAKDTSIVVRFEQILNSIGDALYDKKEIKNLPSSDVLYL